MSRTMFSNRRQFIVGTGTVLIGALGVGTNVLADGHEVSIRIVDVNPEEETVVLENYGDEEVDLDGYQIDWEHRNDNVTQINPFPGGVSIGAGEQLVVWTGYQASDIPAVEADVTMREDVGDAPSDARINNDGNDVIALLSPGGEPVATSDDGDGNGSGDGGDGDDGGDDDDGAGGDGDDDGDDGSDDGDDEEDESGDEETDDDGDEEDEETDEGSEKDDHGKKEKAEDETDEDDC